MSAGANEGSGCSSVPKWADDYNLQRRGCYYEGFVDDYDLVLSQHCMESVTTYGVRKSRKQENVTKVFPSCISILRISSHRAK